MRSRAKDVMGNNSRSRSVDRVSNSSIDLSRLTRSITDANSSSRFNSLNRLRVSSQKSTLDSSKKQQQQQSIVNNTLSGSNISISSTLPSRGRYNNTRSNSSAGVNTDRNKYNFKADPCYTTNIEHLVYANSTRSSFNVKYGGNSNFPLSKNNSMERRLLEERKMSTTSQQMQKSMNKSRANEVFNRQQQQQQQPNKTKQSTLNTSSGGSKSFDSNVFLQQRTEPPQRSTSPLTMKSTATIRLQQPSTQSGNNRQNSTGANRIKTQQSTSNMTPLSTASMSTSSRPNNSAKYNATKSNSYITKQQSAEVNKPPINSAISRNRLEQQQQCNSTYEDASSSTMLHSNNKISTTTTILQETTPNRRNNVSILQVRSVSEPNHQPQTSITKHHMINTTTMSSTASSRGNNGTTITRTNTLLLPPPPPSSQQQQRSSGIPVYRSQSNAANLWKSAAGKIVTCAASNKAKNEASASARAQNTREMSPVRWCDEEVQGVYLGRSGWVQVCGGNQQNQRNIPKAMSTDNEQLGLSSRITRPESLNLGSIVGGGGGNNESIISNKGVTTMPPPPQQYSRSISAPVEPGPMLLSDEDQMLSLNTPIISPPLAFQDERDPKPQRSKMPRSNAFDFPDPEEVTKAFLLQTESRYSPTKKQTSPSKLGVKTKLSSEESSGSSTGSFRTAASSGGMRSVTPSWRGGSGGGSGGGGSGGGGGRHSCESCSSESSRHRSSSEESLSFLAGTMNLSPDIAPKSRQFKLPTHQRYHHHGSHSSHWRHNGVLHLSDSNTPARKHGTVDASNPRRTVTSPESSTSSASSSPARHERSPRSRGNRLELPSAGAPKSRPSATMQRAQSSGASRNYGAHLSPQCETSGYHNVKRSTSLQLPSHSDFPQAGGYRDRPPKPAPSIDTESQRSYHSARSQQGKPRPKESDMQGGIPGGSSSLGWHQAELRAVTDYLSSARSRTAARALLLQRYLNQQGITPDMEDDLSSELLEPTVENSGRSSSASFNVVYVDNNGGNNKPSSGRSTQGGENKVRENIKTRIPWKRGSSAPSTSILGSDEEIDKIPRHQTKTRQNIKYQQCCNPATCDFWPECEHQNVLSSNNKNENRKPYLCQIRPSLSYPSPCNNNDSMNQQQSSYQRSTSTNFQQQQSAAKRRDRSITAPCSLDRVDEDQIASHVKTITIPKRDIYTKNSPRRDEEPCSPVEKNGFRNSSSDDLSTSADDLDEKWSSQKHQNSVTQARKSPSGSINKQLINNNKSSDSDSPNNKKLSPNNELLTPTGRPHSADCLLRRRQYSSTMLKAHSERNSPIVEESPVKVNDESNSDSKGSQQRSLSLPKSFLSNRPIARPKIPTDFSWQNNDEESDRLLRVAYPVSALSTPNTPGHIAHKSENSNEKRCFGSSTPKERVSPNQGGSSTNFLANALRGISSSNNSSKPHQQRRSSTELSVLQKFKKSLAQRFQRKSSSPSSNKHQQDMMDQMSTTPITPDSKDDDETDSPLIQDLLLPQTDTDAYFKRIGPLWRQKDPNNGSSGKSCRNSKCSSGDSGFQMEEALKSLETESTPQELSPEVQRRIKSPANMENNNVKKTRPLSEVLNETFLEKYKLDGEDGKAEGCARTPGAPQVRRTHSDLGGSPLLRDDHRSVFPGRALFKRQISSPSPLKMRPHCLASLSASKDNGLNSASEEDAESNVVLRRTSAASTDSNVSILSATPIQRQQQLRRSISQPMGINELSPLLRRRPSGIPSVIPRRVVQRRRARGRRRSKGACSEDDGRAAASSDYDEDDETDSECSSTSSLSRKHSYEIRPLTQVVLAEAVWDHVTMDTEELAFKAGELIEVVDCTSDKDWWFGQIADKKGWFPAAFVRFRVSQDDTLEDCLASMAASKAPSPSETAQARLDAGKSEPLSSNQNSGAAKKSHNRTRSSVSLMSNDQVRASVVREIINTERDFVRNLTDVVEGYLWECRRREDLFTSQQLMNIFGNLEELLEFQTCFLSNLETKVVSEDPCQSCLGQTFLQHSSGFHIYSEYCNGHPIAQATLQELYAQPGYKQFFEACRLVRGLINISLDGFLLTPVQRICKYPLQLGELIKYTRSDHPDYEDVRAALEAMRSVATLVNERKRRMESLEKLAAWQQRVEGWEGEDLIDLSSQLIHQGEAVRVTSGRWSSNVKLFLFDRQLLYCKRDLLRRGLFVYKGRIALDHCTIMDVPDGKDVHLGISVRHGIKLVSRSGPSGRPPVSRGAVQWLLLCFRSAEEKIAWLRALAEERGIVAGEQARGLQLEPSARELARLLTNRQNIRPQMKPNAKSYSKRRARQGLVPHLATSETSLGASCQSFGEQGQHSLGRKVGNWFTFSSSKKQHRRSPPVNRGGSLQQLLPQ